MLWRFWRRLSGFNMRSLQGKEKGFDDEDEVKKNGTRQGFAESVADLVGIDFFIIVSGFEESDCRGEANRMVFLIETGASPECGLAGRKPIDDIQVDNRKLF